MNADDLRESADRLVACANKLQDPRATDLLETAERILRDAAGIYEQDPSLVSDRANRDRPLWLLAEIGRQLKPLITQAVRGNTVQHRPIPERWAEAEAMIARMPDILTEARAAVVDTSQREGSQYVSAQWLWSSIGRIEQYATDIRAALAPSLSLPYPDQTAIALAKLADNLTTAAAAFDLAMERHD